ncbi:MAG: hypothetical protein A3J80_10050 [Desulfobacula sp. RIFOXYB2_FULL_45_6]|nr:MAG: hypothetical protein A3J80_10050 [Desulfobacula sp. RIFOXYB2_FULL_45_6]
MAEYGLEKIIHKKLDIDQKTYQLLESVNKILVWHDLLYTNEDYPRWSVYFMALLNRCSHKVCEQICDRLNMPLKERSILMEKRYKAEKQLVLIEKASSYTGQDLYWALIGFKTEYILYMMALATHEETRKSISNFYTRQRTVKPYIRGRDLMDLGLKPSPVFTVIFNQILNEKLEGRLKTKKEELAFAREYARSNKFID